MIKFFAQPYIHVRSSSDSCLQNYRYCHVPKFADCHCHYQCCWKIKILQQGLIFQGACEQDHENISPAL